MHKIVKLKDVAKQANVSVASVSRYINNPMMLRECTREKIKQVLEHMDYVPNKLAASLRTKRTQTIALIIPGLSANLYYVDMCNAIHTSIANMGYYDNLYVTNGNNELLRLYLKELPSSRCDGVIVCHLDDDPEILALLEETQKVVPLVLLTAKPDRKQFNNVAIDVYGGVKKATEYLIGLGRKRIGFVSGPENTANIEKLNGYKEGLMSSGMAIDDKYIVCGLSNNFYCGYYAMQKYMELMELPDGIVCATDDIAIGCLKQCQNFEIKIPDDIALIGFNGIELLNTYSPSISSICQPMQAVANALVSLLMDNIKYGNENKQMRLLHCDLLPRESTG